MMGWFYGFKLYLIINDQGGIILVKVTTDNVDDRKLVLEVTDKLWGCLYGDKGYISGPLEWKLTDKGMTLITGMKKNMKPKVMKFWDRLIFQK
ncbi:Mobile element protein [Candidatus Enterovibrio escicola]|uniref:Mobile element protein n=1 Tax=Candidatus Enterovibrio escicola TaxID=1927127 RepID=A0A2A5T4Q2_9GAMM|nr:Mobile element protein [Candidatus Enterovibrio escacola]